jgi:outer membrane receptor protein involved in Fe transport
LVRRRCSRRGPAASTSATTSRPSPTTSSRRGGPIRGNGTSSVNGQTGSKQFHNRTTIDASVSHSASDFLKGSHDFKFGVQTAYATQRTVSIRFSNVSYTDLNAAPYLATFQDPLASGGRIRTAGGYAQDNWTLNDRVTLNLGVRYDNIRGDIPELSAGATLDGISGDASFTVPNSITYPAVEDLIAFNTCSPRAGITIRADQSGKTVVKANYGRFFGKLATGCSTARRPARRRRRRCATTRRRAPTTFRSASSTTGSTSASTPS